MPGLEAPVLVIGEALVEIMADTPGEGFPGPIALTGPYPSGAPAIFADQLARLGRPVAFAGGVGADDFGRLLRARLAGDGVDVTGLAEHPDRPTGTAFVRYRPDGARDFVFNIAHAAAGFPPEGVGARAGARARHLHVMGSSLAIPRLAAGIEAAARAVRAGGGTISFDPNIRKELMTDGARAAHARLLAMSDLYLPGEAELDVAPGDLLAAGRALVVVKRGAAGAVVHGPEGVIEAPALAVEAVDPTGAGDCFDAAFVDAWLAGWPHGRALVLALAAGAAAAAARGPMEGAARRDALIARAGL